MSNSKRLQPQKHYGAAPSNVGQNTQIRWEDLAESFKITGMGAYEQQTLVHQISIQYADILKNEPEAFEILRGIAETFKQIVETLFISGREHGVHLKNILASILLERPELLTPIQNGAMFYINNPEEFAVVFTGRVADAFVALGGHGVLEPYDLMIDASPYLENGAQGMIVNPMLPSYIFKTGIIKPGSEDYLTYLAISARYEVLKHNIGETSATMVMELTPTLGFDPKYANEITKITEAANAVLKASGIPELAKGTTNA